MYAALKDVNFIDTYSFLNKTCINVALLSQF